MGIAYGDEGGIPVPLMGIQAGGRPGVRTCPVRPQHLPGLLDVAIESLGGEESEYEESQPVLFLVSSQFPRSTEKRKKRLAVSSWLEYYLPLRDQS